MALALPQFSAGLVKLREKIKRPWLGKGLPRPGHEMQFTNSGCMSFPVSAMINYMVHV
jgi:hypothetical protein